MVTDFSDKSVQKDNFLFIPSIKHENELGQFCTKLKLNTGIDYFSLCIEANNKKFYLSNNPGNIAIPYHLRGLSKIDVSFSNLTEGSDYFFPEENHDPLSGLFMQTLQDEFHVFNHYGIIRETTGYSIKAVLGGCKPAQDKLQLHHKSHKFVEQFTAEFIKYFRLIIIDNAPWLKYSKIYQDEFFATNLTCSKLLSQKLYSLSNGEKMCLYWFKEGLSVKEIARTTNYSANTVNSYFKSIKEKLSVRSNQQAMLIALQKGWIS